MKSEREKRAAADSFVRRARSGNSKSTAPPRRTEEHTEKCLSLSLSLFSSCLEYTQQEPHKNTEFYTSRMRAKRYDYCGGCVIVALLHHHHQSPLPKASAVRFVGGQKRKYAEFPMRATRSSILKYSCKWNWPDGLLVGHSRGVFLRKWLFCGRNVRVIVCDAPAVSFGRNMRRFVSKTSNLFVDLIRSSSIYMRWAPILAGFEWVALTHIIRNSNSYRTCLVIPEWKVCLK